jgi:pimeloyl-ACP methyl ester carboxylesterase
VGERSHLVGLAQITCSTHVLDVANVIRWEELHDVVLCGHSYGGIVIAGVADAMPERIEALVYLDAIVPEAGESLLDLNRSPEVVAGIMQATAAAGGTLTPALPAALFGINAKDVEWVDRMCTPHPFATFCEPLALTGRWLDVPRKTYVRATGWQGYDKLGFDSYRTIADDAAWRKVDVPCGHAVMLDAPEALAGILVNA